MKGNHPKRRKDKYNPYKIYELNVHYYIEFKDSENINIILMRGGVRTENFMFHFVMVNKSTRIWK